jgi:DNA-binding NarL/FixJ family response regulator/Arc/MetJ-type ribon-helix-helix transcriptional regulator
VTARADTQDGYRKVTAVLTEQQHRWAEEVVLSGAMEGLTCSVSTVIRLALEELRERHPSPKKLEAALRAHIWRERVPEAEPVSAASAQRSSGARSRFVSRTQARPPQAPVAAPPGRAPEPAKVLLMIEQAMLRAGLRSFLGDAPDMSLVAELQEADAAITSIRREPPDVTLIDLSIPDRDLAALIRGIVSAGPQVKVILLATPKDRDRILAAVDAGAVGCLPRDTSPEELMDGIRAVVHGASPLSLSATLALLGNQPERPPLTTRERQILALVARGLANKQIAGRLGISEKTVKTHLGSAFQRLGVSDRTQAAIWAERNGLLKEPQS